MDTTILSGMAGVLGVAGWRFCHVGHGWITQRTLNRRELLAAETRSHRIAEQYFSPNLSLEQMRAMATRLIRFGASPKRVVPSSDRCTRGSSSSRYLTNRRERVFGALAEHRRRWAKLTFSRNDSNLDPFWFRRQTHEFDTIIEHVIERI